ncbi:GntR family transcriptional regulator [Salipiger marinus]|uniref:GntR family transcriptional regulator n=1 Tax=Salipiger marinus TaxID=555512 RepID=UPI000A3F9E08
MAAAASPRLSLHDRILSDLESRILSGAWPPGHRIPTEQELRQTYGCSRMTVNKVDDPAGQCRAGAAAAQDRVHRHAAEIADRDS